MTTTRRRLLELTGGLTMAAAMQAAVRAEGGAAGPRAGLAPVLAAHQTPLRIGAVSLTVRDLGPMADFYRDVIGLTVMARSETEASLGAAGNVLLVLMRKPEAPFEPRNAAGLFHTAFLMPTRRDLARWLVHAAHGRVRLTGFADHAVSEAIYLDDPEGNGIEVYADRAPEFWRWDDGTVTMTTDQLDIDDLVGLTDTRASDYAGAPEGLRIGHVHLKVGDIARGRDFYTAAIGLDRTRERSGAAFLSSGRYHHHLGLNVWQSSGAGRRDPAATGLAWFSLELAGASGLAEAEQRLRAAGAPVTASAGGLETADHWGTVVKLVARPA